MIAATILAAILGTASLPAASIPSFQNPGYSAASAGTRSPAAGSNLPNMPNRGNALPGGGTPEPASMLLLVGGALGYGAHRLRRARGERPAQSPAK